MSTTAKNKFPIRSAIIFSLILIVILIAFLVYQFVYIPSQIAASLNKNIDILNTNTSQSKEIFENVAQKLQATEDAEKVDLAQRSKDIDDLKTKLNDLSAKIDTAKSQVTNGSNDDTKAFASSSKDMLQKRAEYVTSTIALLNNQNCLLTKVNGFNEKFTVAQTLLQEATAKNDSAELITKSRQAADSIDQGSESFKQLSTCFDGVFSKYYTTEIKTQVDNYSGLYAKLTAALRKLADGVEKNDEPTVTAASNEIAEVSKQNTSIFENAEFKKLEDIPKIVLGDSITQIDQQQKDFDQTYDNLKKKYSLETN